MSGQTPTRPPTRWSRTPSVRSSSSSSTSSLSSSIPGTQSGSLSSLASSSSSGAKLTNAYRVQAENARELERRRAAIVRMEAEIFGPCECGYARPPVASKTDFDGDDEVPGFMKDERVRLNQLGLKQWQVKRRQVPNAQQTSHKHGHILHTDDVRPVSDLYMHRTTRKRSDKTLRTTYDCRCCMVRTGVHTSCDDFETVVHHIVHRHCPQCYLNVDQMKELLRVKRKLLKEEDLQDGVTISRQTIGTDWLELAAWLSWRERSRVRNPCARPSPLSPTSPCPSLSSPSSIHHSDLSVLSPQSVGEEFNSSEREMCQSNSAPDVPASGAFSAFASSPASSRNAVFTSIGGRSAQPTSSYSPTRDAIAKPFAPSYGDSSSQYGGGLSSSTGRGAFNFPQQRQPQQLEVGERRDVDEHYNYSQIAQAAFHAFANPNGTIGTAAGGLFLWQSQPSAQLQPTVSQQYPSPRYPPFSSSTGVLTALPVHSHYFVSTSTGQQSPPHPANSPSPDLMMADAPWKEGGSSSPSGPHAFSPGDYSALIPSPTFSSSYPSSASTGRQPRLGLPHSPDQLFNFTDEGRHQYEDEDQGEMVT